MSRRLRILKAGPAMTVQDSGRPGWLGYGLSRGGAADRFALAEGAALLGQDARLAAIEMAAMGGDFEASEDVRIALTGAPMRATSDGAPLLWNSSHLLGAGSRLTIGPVESGVYGYLHVGGGIATQPVLGGRGAHLTAGIGKRLSAGDELPVGDDTHPRKAGLGLVADDRFAGGPIRIVEAPQSQLFSESERVRFEATPFRRDAHGNRMGVRLLSDGPGFQSEAGLSILSETIIPGDIQITGDGAPYVLLTECQTTGGYPRIGTVLPCDLPRVAQTPAGGSLQFSFVDLDGAVEIMRQYQSRIDTLPSLVSPLTRDPHRMADLLSYQLIGGVTAGDDAEVE